MDRNGVWAVDDEVVQSQLATYRNDLRLQEDHLGAQIRGCPVNSNKPQRVRLLVDVRGDWPIGHLTVAPAGEYLAHLNKYGAVSVIASDGSLLGVKPDEFEWIEEIQ